MKHALIAAVVGLVAVAWVEALTARTWDWDLNHLMYFGQRLLAGDLHWTREFDDKLPVVQLLFALPAAADSFALWRMMSMAAILAGAWAAHRVTAEILGRFPDLDRSGRQGGALFAGVATAYGLTSASGGVHHVNPMAASAAILSIALLMGCRGRPGPGVGRLALFAGAAALASLAIGIRPYFLPPLCAAALWVALRAPLPGESRWGAVLSAAGWVAAVGLFGGLANIVPYLLIGELEALVDGLTMLAQDLNPQGLRALLTEEYLEIFVASPVPLVLTVLAALAAALAVAGDLRGGNRGVAIDVLVVVVLLPGLIQLMILRQHFWPHYLQMFVPFFAVGLGVFLALLTSAARLAGPGAARLDRVGKAAALVVILVGVVPELTERLGRLRQNLAPPPSGADPVEALERYLAGRPEGSRDFLAPEWMYVHWRLNEPRHGFPHAAHTAHIAELGWWRDLTPPASFDLPTDTQGYCAKLEAQGPSVILSRHDGRVRDCLRRSAVYRPAETIAEIAETLTPMELFERR